LIVVLKLLILLVLLSFLALVGFAYLGDVSPQRVERAIPVTLDEK